MSTGLLIGEDEAVSLWTYKSFNIYPQPVNKAWGVMNGKGNLVGGILFQNFNGVALELSCYTQEHTITLGICRAIAHVVISDFKVGRLTVVTSRRNKRLIRACLKLGFKIEGVMRCFYGHIDNKKNTGVRLVAFKDALNKVAYRTTSEHKNAIQ